MAVQWIEEVRQTAALDEGEQLAVRLLQEPFQGVREVYAEVEFEVVPFAMGLASLVQLARRARAEAMVAQNRYELESEERRTAVVDTAKWHRKLQAATRYAKAKKHPLGDKLPKLVFTAEVSADTWSRSVDGMTPVLTNLAKVGDLTKIGLPADFYAQGVALFERLGEERDDAVLAESSRFLATARLETLLDEIVEQFELIVAARDLVMELHDIELPGLELSLVKSAAAPRPRVRPAPEPTTPPAKPEQAPPVEADDSTGL